jgi:tetratricopeptide (TPR) repeat protein
LAHHWELSDSPDRSIEYLVLAGEKSNRSQAAKTAGDFFTRALDQIERSEKAPDPKLMIRIRSGRALPFHAMGKIEESFGDYQEAIRLARETGDQQTVLECLTRIPSVMYNTKLKDEVPYFCEQGLELARTLEDKGAEAYIMTYYAFYRHFWQGSNEYETVYHALSLAEQSGQPAALFNVQVFLALMERWRGNAPRSLELSEGMVEMLRSLVNMHLAGFGSFVRGMALTDVGRYNEAIRFLGQWIDILDQNSIYFNLGRCYCTLGWTYSELYDLEKAFRLNNQAVENAIALRRSPAMLYSALEMQAMAEVNLMENKFEMGKVVEAWEHMTRFEKEGVHPDYDFARDRWFTRMKDLKGTILLNRGDLDGAEELARQCLDVATKRQYKKYLGKAERLLGEALTKRGAYDLAEAKLRASLAKLEEVGNPKQLWITHTSLARLYEKMKRPDLEREHWKAAAVIVESTAGGLQEEGLRNTFLKGAPVQEILKHSTR